ncbi:UNVERIFIED_CONTAM: hypothetical protein Scaly_1426700 [Sesamum calycinum]|uniref:Reverse transcriptase Ty1/copia-type domain-containing protein n=1 Tax=Sesamum calycinum TaxID=2727403 RepID=A0AAW2PMN5_9LAMI
MPTPIPDVESIVHLSSVLPHSTPEPVPESLDTMPATVHTPVEPKSFAEANQNDDWRKAMQLELHALKQNETWNLTTLPEGNKTIGSRWVYKVKILPDGKDVKDYLAKLFTIKDLGFACYFWGLNWRVLLMDARFVSTPLPPGIRFDNASGA